MRLTVTRTQRLAVVAVAVVLLVGTLIALSLTGRTTVSSDERALPTATFVRFDGEATSFDDFEGTPLVVNFWASWCPACVNELPAFQAVHERIGDEVTILGIANIDRRSESDALAAAVGLTYVLADDPQGELFRALDLIAMPSTVFIDADGEIREVFAGQLTEEALLERIEDLRAERP